MYTYVHPLYTIYVPCIHLTHALYTPSKHTRLFDFLKNNPLIRYWRDRYLQPFYDLEHKVRMGLYEIYYNG